MPVDGSTTLVVSWEEQSSNESLLVDAWRSLAIRAENPFCTPDWHQAWLAAHPEDRSVVFSVRSGGRVVGILPLTVSRGSAPSVVRTAGAELADYTAFLCEAEFEPQAAKEVIAAVTRLLGPLDVWRVDRAVAGSGWDTALAAAAEAPGVVVRPWRTEAVISIPLDASESPFAVTKDRREAERLGRRLAKDHAATMRISAGRDVARDVAALLELRNRRWQTSRSPQEEAFLVDLARRFDHAGLLRLRVLESSGRMIAGQLGYSLHGRSFAHLQAFDQEYARAGPGTWVMASAILDAAARGEHTFDLLRGEEQYKKSFLTERRAVQSYFVTRSRTPAAAALLLAESGRVHYRRLPNGLRAAARSAAARFQAGVPWFRRVVKVR